MNETYHSRHGAMQESNYVFIEKGLGFLCARGSLPKISVLEVGFGTGLNAWLSLRWAREQKIQLRYHSLETFPLPAEIWNLLNYHSDPAGASQFQKLHQEPWHEWHDTDPFFRLYKENQSLQTVSLHPSSYDLIFFDAFAPNKQPEMWEYPMLEKVISAMKQGAVFVTYCAKGQLKRDLKSLKLEVESLAGPPGKREMIRAIKI
jgi:tRNA U34 5-methylaminomethyl-2-thiouridine-forming methyltransferase MnmC